MSDLRFIRMLSKRLRLSRLWCKVMVLTAIVALVLLLVPIEQQSIGNFSYGQRQPVSSFSSAMTDSESLSSIVTFGSPSSLHNSTLGFNGIVAVSRGTPWWVKGMMAAATASNISLQIPEQPVWSNSFVKSFELFGPVDAHGAALAWLAHIDVLKFIIQNRWGSALVLEDDIDWSVDIREQCRKVAEAVTRLTGQKAENDTPYGLDWDIIWMGHCGDPPDFKHRPYVAYKDPTVLPLEEYRNIDRHITTQLKEGQRAVHFSARPICTWAYAVSANGARRLLAEASEGHGGAYDLMMMNRCKDEKLRCITVNMELFDTYHPADGDQSEVRAGDSGGILLGESSSSQAMGHTNNILKSARCAGLYGSTCT